MGIGTVELRKNHKHGADFFPFWGNFLGAKRSGKVQTGFIENISGFWADWEEPIMRVAFKKQKILHSWSSKNNGDKCDKVNFRQGVII